MPKLFPNPSLCSLALFVAILPAFSFSAEPPSESKGPAGQWELMRGIRPRQYLCHHTNEKITIDGRADEPAWRTAEWTDDFVDIEGARRPKPRFRTRAKMLWDDDYLYIHAELEEPHVWATIKKKNEIIFRDPDFEVFISPDGSNHHYHEFEMNALNTIWELSLDKPYRDGGPCRDPDNISPGIRSAVHIRGTLNNPADTDEGWSVELAFPWKGLAKYAGKAASPPREGDTWRAGFSRVEWLIDIIHGKYRKIEKPEDNWIWSPQGIVDMHAPERWGFVQFTRQPPGRGKFVPDPAWPAREALMEVYHRQREFKRRHDRYAAGLAELGWDGRGIAGFPSEGLELAATKDGYEATATLRTGDGRAVKLHTRQDSLIWEDR